MFRPDGLCVATASTWVDHDANDQPVQALPYTSLDRISWWVPNKAAYRHWFNAAGFSNVDVEDPICCTPDRAVFSESGVRMNHPMVMRLAHARP